jgi:hypothetical protein
MWSNSFTTAYPNVNLNLSFKRDGSVLQLLLKKRINFWVNYRKKWIFYKVISTKIINQKYGLVDCVWNVMAHTQKPDFVFRQNGWVHLNRRGFQFSWLLVAEVCTSAVVMLDTACSEVVWRVLATHCIHQFPLHFPSRSSPCAITFQLDSTLSSSVNGECFVIFPSFYSLFLR